MGITPLASNLTRYKIGVYGNRENIFDYRDDPIEVRKDNNFTIAGGVFCVIKTMNWFKFYGQDWLTDPKLTGMSAVDKLCFITLLCLASGSGGKVKNLDEEALKHITHLYYDVTCVHRGEGGCEWCNADGVLKRLEEKGMISYESNELIVTNYKKRQETNLTNAERQARFREKKKTPSYGSNARVEESRVEETRRDKKRKEKKVGRFAPPSLQEVSNYCLERKNGISPQGFIDFYESKGWYVGKNKMVSWKAAVRNWEARDKESGGKKQVQNRDL